MENLNRDVTSFIEDVTNEKVEHKITTATLKDFIANPDDIMRPIYDFVEEQLNLGKLGYGEVRVDDADLSVRLETNLINLPLSEIKRIDKMISDEDELPLNVYLVMISPNVNVSGLRIDEVASADDFVGNLDTYLPMMNDWVADHLAAVQENMKTNAEKEAEESAAAKKAPAKKSTVKKAAPKRTTARKSAAKKTTAKKSTRKSTPRKATGKTAEKK
ncbi:hypothetical protein [Lentilactobacillus parafarraginis]|uniref:Uncharacterized protein n=1 Tax=Lentilactobacillus parafarraginis DSM 18390 = JCM 14109 TaxID=1423786 RepID=A0A0R1Y3A9_9LACO|nr:hypothetical protein [Lentilactobacillus parafarraginis]KRM36477.1 hypothetical protein FD47_GL000701 [Lentilactobacillus parafarraginis DSM 18390 = JCM 14109]